VPGRRRPLDGSGSRDRRGGAGRERRRPAMTRAPISGVLITFNEERRLRAAIESLSFCSEVLVVDSGSTDRTREIAAEAGARVIVNAPWPGFSAQRNFALDRATHD